jgi:hypothetical protein
MKKYAFVIFTLASLSLLSGILISKMSFIARTAISVFKKKYYYYSFMKIWWQGALFNFVLLMLLLGLQIWMHNKLSKSKALLLHLSCLALAIIGLYFTYSDFRTDLSHRWAGERLHLGFYLFWIGWMIISVFMLWQNTQRVTTSIDKTGSTNL